MVLKPWAEGPLELLKHALDHLKLNTDFDSRIAMISIDNAVELMIRTYFGVPRRVTGMKKLTRNEIDEIIKTFPSLLDGLEKFVSDKIVGIELGDIEWYHRLRNQLYHNGNGITVEKTRVKAYSEIAKVLFSNLFSVPVDEPISDESEDLLGNFILQWAELVHALIGLGEYHRLPESTPIQVITKKLTNMKILPSNFIQDFHKLSQLRNEIVHGISSPNIKDLIDNSKNLNILLSMIRESYKFSIKEDLKENADWKGAAWDDKFLSYDSPIENLNLIEDRPFEQCQCQMH